MARAYSAPQPNEYGQEPADDLQSLRSELVALLDQVESQVSRTRGDDREYRGISERMRDLRHQMVAAEPDNRHREALRSVKRAVERFSDRDDYPPMPGRSEGYPPNPRDTLQSAIQQIRARQGEFAPLAARTPEPPRYQESPRFDELARAVGGISGRLERLEGELRGATKIQTGNVKEIAEQVAQLSHVVELLAGAVGESGQVKRLESQIASLASLVAQGPQVDLSALTRRLDDLAGTVGVLLETSKAPPPAASFDDSGMRQRLDDVSSTVGRLADLQVQYANRVDITAQQSGGMTEKLKTIEGSVKAIEDGVRNVYDRIDAIEKTTALPAADLDQMTDQLARMGELLRQPAQPEGVTQLVGLVEELNRRVSEIESPSLDVGELKIDMAALRSTVVEAMEPRFAAIEMQIEALNDRVAAAPGNDISVDQLEAQVRQLVARMDQTGEQLTGLAKLYNKPVEREPAPDFDALADLVAARTSEAVTLSAPQMPAAAGMTSSDMDEIELRVARLLTAAQSDKPNDDLVGIEDSIRAVNERLARLETSLAERAAAPVAVTSEPDWPASEPPEASLPPVSFDRDEPPEDPIAPLLTEAAAGAMTEARTGAAPRRDAMPANPGEDAPLRDKPFGPDTSAIKAALEVKNGPRRHPGLDYEDTRAPAPPSQERAEFDPSTIERPPRPVSSFESSDETFARPEAEAVTVESVPDELPPNTNTFIAAARRAAQRQHQTAAPAASGSLIARAFASFQAGKGAEAEAKDTPAAPGPKSGKKKGRVARLLAGDKESPTQWSPDESPATADPEPVPAAPDVIADIDAGADEAKKESFLSRHRRPILLAASVVAIAFLTLNLINQRMGQSAAPASTSRPALADTVDTSAVDIMSPEPMSETNIQTAGPRVIPIVDSLATASIDPGAASGFAPSPKAPSMPAVVAASALGASASEVGDEIEVAALPPKTTPTPALVPLESPVKVDMPPDSVGPQALREAAANGDARAQFEVAAIYTEGRAVAEDLKAAAVWYERSAAQGFAPAQYRLGNLYENGRGVAKDLEQAKLWYQRAAEAGNRMAMHNLAALHASGELGKQEFDTAAEWFEQAAARGMRDSQFNLGMLYARGLGVPQSLADSYRWFSLAALKGDEDAAKARDDVARSLDAETVSRLDANIEAFTYEPIDLAANYAPIGTWSDKFDPGAPIDNRDVVRSVQAALNSLGYAVGTPDGIAGPKTADAIRAFERTTGMSESGKVNPRLLAVLGSQPV